MKLHRRRRNPKALWGLVLLAVTYGVLLYYRPILTGINELDGLIGVCLGLFISANPAANFLDMLLFEPDSRHRRSLRPSDVLWLALNSFVLLTGLIVIMISTKRFFKSWQ